MAKPPKKKLFYQVDEACALLGLSLLDMAVLASERKLQLCTAVASLLVEEGDYEIAGDGARVPIPTARRRVQGLVDLRPPDAWFVLRQGSETIFWLAAPEDSYCRLISNGEEDRGYTVIRDEIGLRHDELMRFAAEQVELDDLAAGARRSGRGSQPLYDWDAARLEACRYIYFEGVPASYGALIRHVEEWFAGRGSRVPDESTLKRRLRDIWAVFGSEAAETAA